MALIRIRITDSAFLTSIKATWQSFAFQANFQFGKEINWWYQTSEETILQEKWGNNVMFVFDKIFTLELQVFLNLQKSQPKNTKTSHLPSKALR